MPALPRIAFTMGDPAGIGPELCLKLVHHPEVRALCDPLLVGDARVFADCVHELNLTAPAERELFAASHLEKLPPLARATAESGRASYQALLAAIAMARRGEVQAIVTAPLTKAALHMAGIHEPGHTEILAHETGTTNYAMMLYSSRLAVSLVTIHQSLTSVPAALATSEIVRIGRLTHATLQRLRPSAPRGTSRSPLGTPLRLAVLGLNPHAGEGGIFGDEETRLIAPAVAQLRAEGIEADGPLSPDAAFQPRALERYDGHVCMYHDQGLIPFKMVSSHDGVNLTMGLPIVRTSPDHGTAYDIAWRNQADPSSMLEAVRVAVRLAAAGEDKNIRPI